MWLYAHLPFLQLNQTGVANQHVPTISIRIRSAGSVYRNVLKTQIQHIFTLTPQILIVCRNAQVRRYLIRLQWPALHHQQHCAQLTLPSFRTVVAASVFALQKLSSIPRSVNVWTIVWINLTKIIALEDVCWSAQLTLITSPITTNVWINVQKDGSLIIPPEFVPGLVMLLSDISHISPQGCVCLCVPITLTLTKEYVYRLVWILVSLIFILISLLCPVWVFAPIITSRTMWWGSACWLKGAHRGTTLTIRPGCVSWSAITQLCYTGTTQPCDVWISARSEHLVIIPTCLLSFVVWTARMDGFKITPPGLACRCAPHTHHTMLTCILANVSINVAYRWTNTLLMITVLVLLNVPMIHSLIIIPEDVCLLA